MIQAALVRTTNLRVVSICDSPVSLMEQAARLVAVPLDELAIEYVGMLHYGWIVGITRDGVDLMPRALENIAQAARLGRGYAPGASNGCDSPPVLELCSRPRPDARTPTRQAAHPRSKNSSNWKPRF